MIGYDLIQLAETSRGNKYALTVIDYFSKFVVAWALKSKSAAVVARSLLQTYAPYGTTDYALTDNGERRELPVACK